MSQNSQSSKRNRNVTVAQEGSDIADETTERSKTKRVRAIELLCEGKTDGEVATALSVSTSTICKWRKRPWFAAALSSARQTGIQNAIERLDLLANKAISLLVTVVEDGEIDPKARVKAAAEILDRVGISGAEGMRRRIEQRAFETVYLVLEQTRSVLPPDLFAAVYAAIIDAPGAMADADKAQLSEAVQKRVEQLTGKTPDLSPEELDAIGSRYIDKARQAREALASAAPAGKNAQAATPKTEGAEKG
jgi:hypothetical protein